MCSDDEGYVQLLGMCSGGDGCVQVMRDDVFR